eukprot:TRINITY_DN66334_c8_g1_i1.p1 TRINITY_DN66334_c8_g1~~TRINITY_DN66334_c8_g1_i1.p1  ORF type:complete len:525 (+),score=1.92 TRINITY_DN66334_c8_g1_i1:24-1598(+)
MALLCASFLSLLVYVVAAGANGEQLNVLMIAIDDLRPELGCYGCGHMVSPHIDNLARQSMVFHRAYVSVALCSPSRTALLTSRRPDTSRVWEISGREYWRHSGGNFTTLPQYFKEKGYLSLGMGKVFHPGPPSGNNDVKYSWSPECLPYREGYADPPHKGNPAYAPYQVPDSAMGERKLARHAEAMLEQLRVNKSRGDNRPFFLAVGFHKPHIPWRAPQRFYDMYPLNNMTLAPHQHTPRNVPRVALQDILRGYWKDTFTDLHDLDVSPNYPYDNTTCPKHWAKKFRQAYWAAASFTDSNIGVVLGALAKSGFWNSTIIALWGDHGYQLGDNDEWAKHDNFEHATRIPWMVRLPQLHFPRFKPGRTDAFVEEVDLFPTLVNLVFNETVPRCPQNVTKSRKTEICTEGYTFEPVLFEPSKMWKGAAFSQYERHNEKVMGYTVRTNHYRYTEWVAFDNKTATPNWNNLYGKELYFHEYATPHACQWNYEHDNIVHTAPQSLLDHLHKILLSGWRGSLPKKKKNLVN